MVQRRELSENQVRFIPGNNGFHGSRVLWQGQEGADEYWKAVKAFLNMLYQNQ